MDVMENLVVRVEFVVEPAELSDTGVEFPVGEEVEFPVVEEVEFPIWEVEFPVWEEVEFPVWDEEEFCRTSDVTVTCGKPQISSDDDGIEPAKMNSATGERIFETVMDESHRSATDSTVLRDAVCSTAVVVFEREYV